MGPVLHLLHEQPQVLSLNVDTAMTRQQDADARVNAGNGTSCPLPLKRTLSNRVRRAGSPRSDISLQKNRVVPAMKSN